MDNTAFLDFEVTIVIVYFCIFGIKCLTFSLQKKLMRFLHSEVVNYKSTCCPSIFLKSYSFSKHERIIMHTYLGQRGHTRCILWYLLTYAAQLHIAIYICTYISCMLPIYSLCKQWYKIYLTVLLSELSCTNVSVYFSNRCTANLSLV